MPYDHGLKPKEERRVTRDATLSTGVQGIVHTMLITRTL